MLLDPDSSWALLVGTSVYPRATDLPNVPAVRNNLHDLVDVLTDPHIGRLSPDHCVSLEDPQDPHSVAEALDRVASWTKGTLVFYYAGHGLVDGSPHRNLHLGLTQTTRRLVLANSLPFSLIRDFIGNSGAATRVVILDCCYSGIAAEGTLDNRRSVDVAQLVSVEGSYVLTSSAATRTSMAPAGARHTAFTGQLLRVLRHGIPDGPRELDLDAIYLHTKWALAADGLPEPQRLVTNTAHRLALVLNNAWTDHNDGMSSGSQVDRDGGVSSVAPLYGERSGAASGSSTSSGADSAHHTRPATIHHVTEMDQLAARTSSPTAWRRWLALEIKGLRLAAGLSQADVARSLAWPTRQISRIENCQCQIHQSELRALLLLLKVPGSRWPYYTTAAENAQRKAWWELYGSHTIPRWFEVFIGLEQGAERIRAYQPAVIHGLLQTPSYATAVLDTHSQCSEERRTKLVDLRIRRQEALTRASHPARLSVILDEAALRHIMGDRKTMRDQLEHVVMLAARRNVTIQVVPFDRAGFEAAYGAFTVLTFAFPDDPGLVFMEHPYGALFLEDSSEVDQYSLLFQQVSKRALSPNASLDMIRRCADEYDMALRRADKHLAHE